MNKDRVDSAIAAIDALIRDELLSGDPKRYQRVAKLCGYAHRIEQMAAVRVKSVVPPGQLPLPGVRPMGIYRRADVDGFPLDSDEYAGAGEDDDPDANINLRLPAALGHEPDMANLLHQMIPAMEGLQRTGGETPALKLTRLLDARERLEEMGRDVRGLDDAIALAQRELAPPAPVAPAPAPPGGGLLP